MSRIDENAEFIPVRIAVLTVSDTRGAADDRSGDTLVERLTGAGHVLAARGIVRDDRLAIAAQLRDWIADVGVDVILTTGGVFMPVRYSTSDALLSPTFDPSAGTRFDPNAIKLGCLDPGTGSIFLFLGGLVQPRATQRRGAYAGTVVATVVYTGASCP